MRLALLILILALLGTPSGLSAQEPPGRSGALPWEGAAPVLWQPAAYQPEPAPPEGPPSEGSLVVDLSLDGTLSLLDARGVLRLRAGLPGRPVRAWRDGGRPLAPSAGRWRFPDRTPLRGGLAALPWGAPDFRPALEGLLWIVDDSERVLTVVHPAAGRVAYLPLPGGVEHRLVFHPGHLEAREILPPGPARQEGRIWSVPWIGLLAPLAPLVRPPANPRPGTALDPYPGDQPPT